VERLPIRKVGQADGMERRGRRKELVEVYTTSAGDEIMKRKGLTSNG